MKIESIFGNPHWAKVLEPTLKEVYDDVVSGEYRKRRNESESEIIREVALTSLFLHDIYGFPLEDLAVMLKALLEKKMGDTGNDNAKQVLDDITKNFTFDDKCETCVHAKVCLHHNDLVNLRIKWINLNESAKCNSYKEKEDK